MKTLIHGNDLEKSRVFFNEAKALGKNLVFLNGEGITFDIFFQASEGQSLFSDETTIVIENLFSKNKINAIEIKKILEYINSNKILNIIIWEQTEVSKTSVLQLKDFDVKSFVIPQQMFTFLEQIRPNNSQSLIKLFHELRKTQEPEMILFMIVRQLRLLIQASSNYKNQIDEAKKMASWQVSRLKSQAKFFTKEELLTAYNKLFDLERKQKIGTLPASSLDINIDFFLTDL